MLQKNLLLLIVDDSLLIIKKIVQLLHDDKVAMQIITATDYDRAIKLIDTMQPDVALLDICLPYKSGIDILKYIKARKKTSIVIMFTNDASEQHKKMCYKLGADHFLDKSTQFEKLSGILSPLTTTFVAKL